jgi:uncharacterized protein YceK
MRPVFLLFVGAVALAGCSSPNSTTQGAPTPDSIERLTVQMSADWFEAHSHFIRVDLPPGATPEEVAFRALGRPASYSVVKVRQARIKHAVRDPVAILADVRDEGQLIVLATYVDCGGGWWWTQVYEAK